MNVDGSGLTDLTNDSANDLAPDFSPDGSKIAFSGDRDAGGIYVMHRDGNAQTRITQGNELTSLDPAFSFDGSKLVFAGLREGFGDLYVMNSDGSAEHA
jgi:Tol biopolymer transport system component